ncbi:MAG TPA: response regulator [Syntrophorhabdaceae bacterium]|nr:response regulator [Syntrophorhabdaceae bacterium]
MAGKHASALTLSNQERGLSNGSYEGAKSVVRSAVYDNRMLWEAKAKFLLFSLSVIGILLLAILGWTWSLRRQVKIRTAELRKSEERYRLLVENASEGVMVVIREKIVFINQRALNILDSSEEELKARLLTDIVHAEDQNMVLDFYQNTLNREDVVLQYPFRIVNSKGEAKWILNNSVKIEWEEATGVLNIFTDITESKKLEQQFLQAQKMEAVGQLAGGVAHDFNNILTAIMGYANLLKMRLGKEESLRKYIDNILTSAERAANLTKSLLAFSRKEAVDPKPTDLNETIVSVEKLLSKLIGEDIDFVVKLHGDGLIVMADSNQIIQIFMNLATNARDAMPKGGRLTVSTDIMDMDDAFIQAHAFGRKGLYALISFEDTGMGMDERTIERIFEPFFTTKDVGKGTGLGLATVYGIVKQQNGYINVQSALNQGSTFRIYLPIVFSDLEEVKPARAIHVVGGSETILIGEDEEDIRKFIREILESYGYKVIEAADGEEVVERFIEHEERIDLLILDIIMPKKNGMDAYEEIRNRDGNLKVMFMSGYASDFIEKKGISEKDIRLLYKPVEVDTLLTEIRNVLDEK